MADTRWSELKDLLQQAVGDYLGQVEYGDLRLEVYDSDESNPDDYRVSIAFEVPGGSTSQFAISFEDGVFKMLDAGADKVLDLQDPGDVVNHVMEQVKQIPKYRLDRLIHDIDALIDGGADRPSVLQELNRLLRLGTEFRGGSVTVDELTAAVRHVVARFDK